MGCWVIRALANPFRVQERTRPPIGVIRTQSQLKPSRSQSGIECEARHGGTPPAEKFISLCLYCPMTQAEISFCRGCFSIKFSSLVKNRAIIARAVKRNFFTNRILTGGFCASKREFYVVTCQFCNFTEVAELLADGYKPLFLFKTFVLRDPAHRQTARPTGTGAVTEMLLDSAA